MALWKETWVFQQTEQEIKIYPVEAQSWLSIVINHVAASAAGNMTDMSGISYIPIWLVFLSLVFAILVGMVAGFFPARRAMKLSPLAAIRNE